MIPLRFLKIAACVRVTCRRVAFHLANHCLAAVLFTADLKHPFDSE